MYTHGIVASDDLHKLHLQFKEAEREDYICCFVLFST